MVLLSSLDKTIMVVTSTYVMQEGMPVLYVSNDDDGENGSIWQFHCDNGDYHMEKMLLVRLDTLLDIDPKLSEIRLEIGEEARREDVDSPWIFTKQ